MFQPLNHPEARSLITNYLVEYLGVTDSVKVMFVASDVHWLNISGLSNDIKYTLTLRAVGTVGLNNTVHVNPLHIPEFHNGILT